MDDAQVTGLVLVGTLPKLTHRCTAQEHGSLCMYSSVYLPVTALRHYILFFLHRELSLDGIS